MPFSVRLDPKTERVVTRLARRNGRTKSAIVREALEAYDRSETAATRDRGPIDAMAGVIGAADSGGSRRSEATGEGFRALLAEKVRARRSR
jgi:predicted transcriptional regulator